jgi:hypothetical protein
LLVVVLKTPLFDRFLLGLISIALIISLLLNRLLLGTSFPKRRRESSIILPVSATMPGC